MDSERMLKEWRYLRNQTIEKVRKVGERTVCLHFTSGNFCIISGGSRWEDNAFCELCTYLGEYSDRSLLSMEVITQKEYDERRVKNEEVRVVEAKEYRRRQYEKLKNEFEEGETQ